VKSGRSIIASSCDPENLNMRAGSSSALRLQAAIALQLSAQLLQATTQSSIPPTRSQSLAHSAQISALSRQTCLWWEVLSSMKWAAVLHISAHAIINLKCWGSTCLPPVSRQVRHRHPEAGRVALQAFVDARLHILAHLHAHSPSVFPPYCTFRTSMRPPPPCCSTLLLAV
jgi:hypothetical protein